MKLDGTFSPHQLKQAVNTDEVRSSDAKNVQKKNSPPLSGGGSGTMAPQSGHSTSSAGVSAVDEALSLVRDSSERDLIAIRSKGAEGLRPGEEVQGRLKRQQMQDGRLVTQLQTTDGREINLKPQDVSGVRTGGRVTLYADAKGRLNIDAAKTDAVSSFVGQITQKKGVLYAVSTDPKAPFSELKLRDKDRALIGQTALIHVQDGMKSTRSGQVREVIPEHQVWKKAFTELAIRNGVEATMSSEVQKDVERIQTKFDPESIEGYEDLTSKDFFSVDNPYSLDYDQAMAIEPTPGKKDSLDVYYAIADLSYFLQLAGEDSAVTRRAESVQTTTYLPGFDFPVLPREISEGLCSLNEGEKRPAFVIKFSVDAKGNVSNPEFIDGVIQNRKNGSYPEAQAHINGERVSDPAYARGIDNLKTVGERLLGQADKRGMFKSAEGERWATIDKDSGELKTEKRGQLWIEEANAQISISANRMVGEFLAEHNAPGFHRVHNDPEPRKLAKIQEVVRRLGVEWGSHETPQDVMSRIDTQTPMGRAVRRLLLRVMPRAFVSDVPGSHHGVKLNHYAQSTAPMRRTRDAMNHESVRAIRDGKDPSIPGHLELVDNAQAAEIRERTIDREVRSHLSAEMLSKHVGQKLEGQVVDVSMFGVELYFPEIDTSHTIPLKDFKGGPFNLVGGRMSAVSSDKSIRMNRGETVEVRPLSVDSLKNDVKMEVTRSSKTDRVSENQKAFSGSLNEVRGDGFQSPMVGRKVTVKGVVSAVNSIGFFIQTPGTSGAEAGGLLVRRRGADVRPGDLVTVDAKVNERRNRDSPEDRSIVELVRAKVKVTGHDETAIPPPAQMGGSDGLVLPKDRKAAIDMWRSLLGQRVEVGSSTAVSASNQFGDLVVVPDDWTPDSALRTSEGGLVMPDGEWNHQSVGLKFRPHVGKSPDVVVGANLPSATGVVTYRSGSFQLELTDIPEVTNPPPRPRPVTKLVGGPGQVTIAGVNALNMHPGEINRAKMLGERIVKNLQNPDIIALQEIQDNDGPTASDITDASETYQMLIDEIKNAGGPEYAWFDIPPENNKDGGQPGGNIRNGYLYRKDRVQVREDSVERIGEGERAFDRTRKSLAAVFEFEGKELMVVNNHLSSRRGSSPWTTAKDELTVGKAAEREAQAKIVREFIDSEAVEHPDRDVLIIGDMNDGNASPTVDALTEGPFTDLTMKVPDDKRFDYNYRGTLGVLQPVVGNEGLNARTEIEILHDAVFNGIESSDHDPVIVRIQMGEAEKGKAKKGEAKKTDPKTGLKPGGDGQSSVVTRSSSSPKKPTPTLRLNDPALRRG